MQESSKKQVISASPPLHSKRFKITSDLKAIPIKTGDILFRLGKESFYGLPFSQLVAYLTHSKYSHASIALIENNNIYCLEVNENGTQKYRIQDWVDFAHTNGISVYRVNYLFEQDILNLTKEINKVFDADMDYDFTFNDPNKLYCTKSVIDIYKSIGIEICKPKTAKEVLSLTEYILFCIGNFICGLLGAYIPLNQPMYFVGNKSMGMLSSKRLYKIYEYDNEITTK